MTNFNNDVSCHCLSLVSRALILVATVTKSCNNVAVNENYRAPE